MISANMNWESETLKRGQLVAKNNDDGSCSRGVIISSVRDEKWGIHYCVLWYSKTLELEAVQMISSDIEFVGSGVFFYPDKLMLEENIVELEKQFHKETTLKNMAGHCPKCGSKNVNFGDINFRETTNYQRCVCSDCQCVWNELYKFYGKEIINN